MNGPRQAGIRCGAAFVLVCLWASHAWPQARASERPPNIVIILADDLGYGDLRSYNSGSKKWKMN